MGNFGVGLVAFNMSKSDISRLSRSFRATNPAYKVVVDNSLDPVSMEAFENLGWTYIHNPKNPGFGSSHNLIFREYGNKADFHLVVNPDIYFEGTVMTELINFLCSNEDAGCVMPRVLYPDGEFQRLAKLLPSPIDLVVRRLPFSRLRNNVNKRLELREEIEETGTYRIPFLSGCFLLIKSNVIKSIGLFDERFFMYTEDTDLSRRLWMNKTYPYYYGSCCVIHGYEKGSAKSLRLLKIHISSAIKYFNKWGWIDKKRNQINNDCLLQFKV